MRIAIACGCAEPGRDGVGDHSVRLAWALAADGHVVTVVALRDHEVQGASRTREMREGVAVVRLPAAADESVRGAWLDAELAGFHPDHVLLQFVCWGQAERGILDPLPHTIAAALARHRTSVYVHELWLGLQAGASLRHRWWGRRQRLSIQRFLHAIAPACIVTSNAVHVALLERLGFRAQIVPLLGNLQPRPEAPSDAQARVALARGPSRSRPRREPAIVAVFGTVFPGWEPDAALAWFAREAAARGRDPLVVAFGRASPRGERILDALASRLEPTVPVLRLGAVTAELASGLLQIAHVGMPTTGWELLGKSGVAATMRAHGLPLIVVRREAPFRDLPALVVTHPPEVVSFDVHAPPDFDRLLAQRTVPRDDAPEIARALVATLGRATHSPTSERPGPIRSTA